MKYSVKLTNNSKQISTLLKRNISSVLGDLGDAGVSSIKGETPVLSGKLKSNTHYSTKKNSVIFINDIEYAGFVELGTFLQKPNPFMKRGLMKAKSKFINIIKKGLKV